MNGPSWNLIGVGALLLAGSFTGLLPLWATVLGSFIISGVMLTEDERRQRDD